MTDDALTAARAEVDQRVAAALDMLPAPPPTPWQDSDEFTALLRERAELQREVLAVELASALFTWEVLMWCLSNRGADNDRG